MKLLAVLLLTAASWAQVYSNLDASTTGWQIDAQNAGGHGKGVGTIAEITTAPHGHALKLTVASSDGSGLNNVLFFNQPASSYSQHATEANYFYAEESFYLQSTVGLQVVEFDSNEFYAPLWRFMFGTQCVLGGNWWVWNDNADTSQTSAGWIELNGLNGLPLVPCNLAINTWHNWRQWSHHEPVSSQSCAGFHRDKTSGMFPCSYQDVLEIDGVQYNVNYKSPASDLPAGWASVIGVQAQMGQSTLGTQIQMGVADVYVTALGQ
jgi:hypothetical protein